MRSAGRWGESIRKWRASRLGQQEQEQGAREGDHARQPECRAQAQRLREQPDRLEPSNAAGGCCERRKCFGRRSRPRRKQLGRPRAQHGRGRTGERAPEHVAGHKPWCAGREAEARRDGGRAGRWRTWLANTVKRRPAGSSSTARSAVVAAITIKRRRHAGAISSRSAEPESRTPCHTRPSGSLVQISGAARSPTPPARKR